jgi:uncharacterized protein YndB with AHSA1/START domain
MSSAPPTDDTRLVIRRLCDAAPAEVFRAWTEPEALARWFVPAPGMRHSDISIDLRPGGAWSIAMATPGGEDHGVSGEYLEVSPPARLRFTWAWQSTPDRVSLVTVELRPKGAGTELTLTHERFFDRAARDRHGEGWAACLGQLDAALKAMTQREARQ